MFILNYRGTRPLCEQITDSIRKLVLCGIFQPGELLPGVKELAVKFAINPNTVARAYGQLEREGYVCTAGGEGIHVAEKPCAGEAKKKLLLKEFDAVAGELLVLSVSVGELEERIRMLGQGGVAS